MKLLETDKRNLERQLSLLKSTSVHSKSYERPEKAHAELLGTSFDVDHYEQENRELRLKVRRLETQLAEKEAELIRVKSSYAHTHSIFDFSRDRTGEIERLRAAQLQAEKLLEAREQSHRQQILRLENQVPNFVYVYICGIFTNMCYTNECINNRFNYCASNSIKKLNVDNCMSCEVQELAGKCSN